MRVFGKLAVNLAKVEAVVVTDEPKVSRASIQLAQVGLLYLRDREPITIPVESARQIIALWDVSKEPAPQW